MKLLSSIALAGLASAEVFFKEDFSAGKFFCKTIFFINSGFFYKNRFVVYFGIEINMFGVNRTWLGLFLDIPKLTFFVKGLPGGA